MIFYDFQKLIFMSSSFLRAAQTQLAADTLDPMRAHPYPERRQIVLPPLGTIGPAVRSARLESWPAIALPDRSVPRAVAAARHKSHCARHEALGPSC
jgi:hypothetical protein